jgi:hypothetical protein
VQQGDATLNRMRFRLTLAILLTAALALLSLSSVAQSAAVKLIGYGTLRADFSPTGATFFCQDEQHADFLLGKLRADYTWDPQSGVQPIQLPNGAPALELRNAGSVLVFLRLGSTVRALTAATPAALAALMRSIPIPSTAVYQPSHPYPASLDYFDLNAVRISVTALKPNVLDKGPDAYSQQALAQEAGVWSALHIGMGANVRSFFATNNRIDGPPHTFPMDYEINLARKAGESVNVWFGPAGGPWWFRNYFPDQVDRSEGIWGWQKAPSSQGAVYPSLTMDDAARAYVDRNDLDLLHNIQATAGDSLSSIRIATGRPGDEMAFHAFSNELMNRSPADFQGFRQWLQTTPHLDLASLGQRWFGDPAHYHSWAGVTPPSIYEFFGDLGNDTFDLDHDWLWHPEDGASDQQAWSLPSFQPASDWTTIDLAPSERQLLLLSGTREAMQHGAANPDAWWFRKQFSASAWLAAHHGKPVYLVVEANTVNRNPIQIYLNGSSLPIAPPAPDSRGWIAIDITSHLTDGPNLLAVRLSRDALIRGHVFLTATQPRGYPYLGPQANARWIDLRDWLADKIIDGYARIAAPILAEDPDVPVLLVPGSDWSSANRFLPLKLASGFSAIHDTGSEASYRPHMPGLGYVIGTYASSEESNTTDDPQRLSQELAWFLLNGVSEHNYVPNADVYLPVEQKTKWFSNNARLLQLLGKALWVKPSIAILRSSTKELYLPNTNYVYAWDLGRGDLQTTHRNNVYATEAELKAGLVDPYPVLIDANSIVMDPATVAAIERYVRAGGTFIAVPGTGRNDPLHPDTWPISSLTGFKVLGERGHQSITVDPANPILKAFAGKTFAGEGYGGPSVALGSQAPGTSAIARWQDGSIAIGLRTLGKGRVIVLGSTFWRSNARPQPASPSLQTSFLNDLLAGLNVQADVDCDSDRIWTRRQITKNGLADWIFAYNPDLLQSAAAFTKKAVPLIVVTDKSKAAFVITSTVAHKDLSGGQPTVVVNNSNTNATNGNATGGGTPGSRVSDAMQQGYAAGAAERRALGETSSSIAVVDSQSTQIVFAYAAGKMGTNQLQKTAEDCANHLKKFIEKPKK